MLIFKSGISRKFAVIVTAVFLLLLVFLTGSFHYVMSENSRLIRSILLKNEDSLLLERTGAVLARSTGVKMTGTGDFTRMLKTYAAQDPAILHVLVLGRTGDDDYFRVLEKARLNDSFTVDVEKQSMVTVEGGDNYLRRGAYKSVADPSIYTSSDFAWRNVYHPFRLNRRNLVVGFMVSQDRTVSALREYDESIKRIKRNILIIILAAAVAVFFVMALFIQNYLLLLKKLSGYLNRASRGELELNMSAPEDNELHELADSFNGLMEEMRGLKEREKTLAGQDHLDDVFKTGVSRLKEGLLEDAAALFGALRVLRPESFGSLFNLGVTYAKMRDYDGALKMFQRSLEINPDHEQAREYMEKAIQLKKRYEGQPSEHNQEA